MRGAHHVEPVDIGGLGIIPADAGSTLGCRVCHMPGRDHPRGCGEHCFVFCIHFSSPGSSPRMRGARIWSLAYGCQVRIIPADAGSTPNHPRPGRRPEDHPRGCGEHSLYMAPIPRREGSSPRMRGALSGSSWISGPCRIIPADAGSTPYSLLFHNADGDHPRGCGEHAPCCQYPQRHRGSSPRMRGARSVIRLKTIRLRIIPADAGSTRWRNVRLQKAGDHPRGCGEHGPSPFPVSS